MHVNIGIFLFLVTFSLFNHNMVVSLNYQHLIDFTRNVNYQLFSDNTGAFQLDSVNETTNMISKTRFKEVGEVVGEAKRSGRRFCGSEIFRPKCLVSDTGMGRDFSMVGSWARLL